MNIVTPIPTAVVFTTSNPNTEAARRDNLQRETIPQTSANESSEAKAGLGSESDKLRNPGQTPPPLVYERPQANQNAAAQSLVQDQAPRDNAEDESAGREDAEQRQQEQKQLAEQSEIQQLEQRDQEVRAHEQAHASVGGQYAGSPSYDYQTGPDGKRYAVGGEVSIDIGEESTPEETLRKMQQVKAAALAPAEPSPQDLRVASEATRKSFEARTEISEQRREALQEAAAKTSGEPIDDSEIPDLDDIVDGMGVTIPKRYLDNTRAASPERERLDEALENQQGTQDQAILKRVSVIQTTYQNVGVPVSPGFSATA